MIDEEYVKKLEKRNKLLESKHALLLDEENLKLRTTLMQAIYLLRSTTYSYFEDTQPTVSINRIYDMADDKFNRHLDTIFVEKFNEPISGLIKKQLEDRMKKAGL